MLNASQNPNSLNSNQEEFNSQNPIQNIGHLEVDSTHMVVIEDNSAKFTWSNFFRKHQWELGFVAAITLLLIIGLTYLGVSGQYKTFFSAKLSGQVVDENSKPVSNAALKVESVEAKTDINGTFSFDSVPVSSQKIIINSPKHFYFEDKLDLQTGDNAGLRFQIKTLDYASVTGKLSGENLQSGSIKVFLDSTEIPLNSDYTFNLDRAKLGSVSFKVTSSAHKDVLNQLNLEPGKNNLGEIKLELGNETTFRVSSWANSASLAGAIVKITSTLPTSTTAKTVSPGNTQTAQNQASKPTELKSDSQGNFSFRLKQGEKYQAEASMSGFITKTFDLTEDNNQLELVPEGKIVYTSSREGQEAIYISNYDGTDEKKVYSSKGQLSDVKLSGSTIYFVSNEDNIKNSSGYGAIPQIYKVNVDGGGFTKLSNLKGYQSNVDGFNIQDEYNLKSQKIIYTSTTHNFSSPNQSSKLWISNLDGSNVKLIRDRNFTGSFTENVRGWAISPNADKIAYLVYKETPGGGSVQQTRLITVNTDGSNAKDIYTRNNDNGAQYYGNYLTLFGYNNDGSVLVYQTSDDSNQSTLYGYNFKTGESKKLAFLGQTYIDTFSFDSVTSRFYFTSFRDAKNSLFYVDLLSGEYNKVIDTGNSSRYGALYVEPSFGGIYFAQEGKVKLLRLGKNIVELPIATNFKMWGAFSGYYGY